VEEPLRRGDAGGGGVAGGEDGGAAAGAAAGADEVEGAALPFLRGAPGSERSAGRFLDVVGAGGIEGVAATGGGLAGVSGTIK